LAELSEVMVQCGHRAQLVLGFRLAGPVRDLRVKFNHFKAAALAGRCQPEPGPAG
jgi:hypothetical protein